MFIQMYFQLASVILLLALTLSVSAPSGSGFLKVSTCKLFFGCNKPDCLIYHKLQSTDKVPKTPKSPKGKSAKGTQSPVSLPVFTNTPYVPTQILSNLPTVPTGLVIIPAVGGSSSVGPQGPQGPVGAIGPKGHSCLECISILL